MLAFIADSNSLCGGSQFFNVQDFVENISYFHKKVEKKRPFCPMYHAHTIPHTCMYLRVCMYKLKLNVIASKLL